MKKPDSPQTPLHPLDTLWKAKAILTIVLAGEALALVMTIAPGHAADRLSYFYIASFAVQLIAMFSMGLLYLSRKWLAQRSPVRIAQCALAALLLSTWLMTALAWLFLRDLELRPYGGWTQFTIQASLIALTVGLLTLAAFQTHWKNRQLAVQAKQSELVALQARIRPHFLFNTLNTGIALLHDKPQQAEQLLLDLADLFRAALSGSPDQSLSHELDLVKRYLEIESLRFGKRLTISWIQPLDTAAIPSIRLPTLSLQPLVENAIKHGIEPSTTGGHVIVDIDPRPPMLKITIRNSLPSGGSDPGHGIGLNAVSTRIDDFTAGQGHLRTRIEQNEYVAELLIPLAEANKPSE